ncbi:MAG: glycosyltransferase [Deltaproteobacteria bacterium]|nr:glycosyltransferase [Deltaproteobacteria bacterium]
MRGAMDESSAGAGREEDAGAAAPGGRGRFAFVVPLFNHGRTVRQVVEGARSLGFPVFVVDDGSTDGGAESIAGMDGVTLLRHAANRGKGSALRTGFAAAAKVADWAITVDADGQHDSRQASDLVAAIPPGERALVVGRREGMDRPDIPWKSRFGRKFSNFWVRASGGPDVLDTQTGFRIYPLPETLGLGARGARFQFEVEVLVLARRCGMAITEVPVRVTYSPPGGRVTHYRPWADFWRNSAVFARLITSRLLGPGRGPSSAGCPAGGVGAVSDRGAGSGGGRPSIGERPLRPRWWLLVLAVAALAGALFAAQRRLRIDTDVAASIPGDDPVLAAARGILADHPAIERIAVDVSFADGHADREALADAGEALAERLGRSGLFTQVGLADAGPALAELAAGVVPRLPALFTAEELEREVAPRLEPERVGEALRRRIAELAQLDGVGQAEAIAGDPLDLRGVVLGRLAALLPAGDAHLFRGQLLSGDDRHLLLLLHPAGRATDTATAGRLRRLFSDVQRESDARLSAGDLRRLRLATVGGFRAALDNEQTIRGDTQRAVWIATLGVALLLLACFPRPWLGLLALVPAAAGVILALLVYSLFRPAISALALGFGGALVSITVDQGIAYFLFLDRARAVTGREAAHEIWSAGLFATLTTVAAFLALCWSGYPLLEQLGLFAALAVGLAFLFLHAVFPRIFPGVPAARRLALVPVERWLARAATARGWLGPALAGAVAAAFVVVGPPPIAVDLAAMNHVGGETLADEALVRRVWGDVYDRVVLAATGADAQALQDATDRVAAFRDGERARGAVAAAFVPSDVAPGRARAAANLAAWRAFWTPERRAGLRVEVERRGAELGFSAEAFTPFFTALAEPRPAPALPSADLDDMFGVSDRRSGTGRVWLGTLAKGPRYEAPAVFAGAAAAGARLFDPQFFALRLGGHLEVAFRTMLAVIGGAVVVLLVILFLGLRTVLLTLAPLVFALVVTLGSLRLLGLPLDIPALLLAVVVFGMGVDYAIYFVRGSQRLLDPGHPSFGPLRLTVFLAAASTLLGMVALAVSEHPVLRSAGVTGAIGIASAAVGAFVILPPFLARMFPGRVAAEWRALPGDDPRRIVARRYAGLDPHARLFAWFKLRLDPMFGRLHELVGAPRTLLDVGCGQGVPGTWLLARLPSLRVYGLDPDPERARIAARAFGPRGTAACAAAPELPEVPGRVDAALLLDVAHHLSDAGLRATLRDLCRRLGPGGRLVVRATVPGDGAVPWLRRVEAGRIRRAGRVPWFRSADVLRSELADAGFAVELVEPTAPGREETWFVAVPRAGAGA